jgi:hypothetical protein
MPRSSRLDPDALSVLLANQDAVVTYGQLAELGLPRSTLTHRIRPGGPWQRVLPGVYVTQSGPATVQQRARAALLYTGPDAVLTGCEALVRHGFRRPPPDPYVHVLVGDDNQTSSAGFVLVERTVRPPVPVERFGLPCAPVARAVFDICRRQREQSVVTALVAEAVQRNKCRLEELVTEVGHGQIRGTRLIRSALADVLVGVRSAAESNARVMIKRGKLPEPLWNHDLFLEDGSFLACPDGWFAAQGVALEIDSREWHLDPEGWERTLKRHLFLSTFGIVVVHVTPRRIRQEPLIVVRQLAATLQTAKGPSVPIIAVPTGTRPRRRFA